MKFSLDMLSKLTQAHQQNLLKVLFESREKIKGSTVILSEEEVTVVGITLYDNIKNPELFVSLKCDDDTVFHVDLFEPEIRLRIDNQETRLYVNKLLHTFKSYLYLYSKVNEAYISCEYVIYAGIRYSVDSMHCGTSWICRMKSPAMQHHKRAYIDKIQFINLPEYVWM